MPQKIKTLFNLSVIFMFIIFSFLLPTELFAEEPGPGGGTGIGPIRLVNPLGEGSTIMTIINNILNYLIYISVPILALMILIGGFQILTARDNPEKIKSGRNTIMYATIGFTIILISKGIALVILTIMS